MTNSYPTGSPGVPDASMPTGAPGFMPRRSSYASVVSGAASGHSYPRSGAFSHLLNQNIDSSFDPAYQTLSGHLRNDPRAYDMDFGANGTGHGRSGSWTRGGQLPSFSSAFGSLVNGYGYAGVGGNMDHFFIPSYLKGSEYLQKLEEAHRAKVTAHRDGHSAHSSQPGSLSTSASSVNLHSKMTPSHRGMTYDVIEKAPPMEDESLPPLPSKWNSQDKHAGVEVLSDGQEVKFTGSKSDRDRDHEASAIRADHPMPPQCGIYYYEVTVVSRKREESSIGIGFSSKTVPLSRLPGWEPDSWAYHGDDGNSFCCHSVGKQYASSFTAGDVIGCGVNFRTGSAFFTKNGDYLGPAFREINNKGKLYPSVGMKKTGEHIRVNFGQSPFVFDIDGMMSASNNSHFLPPSPSQPSFSSNLPPATASVSDAASEGSPREYHSLQNGPSAAIAFTLSGTAPPANDLGSLDQRFDTAMESVRRLNSDIASPTLGDVPALELPPALLAPPRAGSPPLSPPPLESQELSALRPPPTLQQSLLPQTTFSTARTAPRIPSNTSPIRTAPRSSRARPYIPSRSLPSIGDAAHAEYIRSGMIHGFGDERYGFLLGQMRALVAESLSNNGSIIFHSDLSPEALRELNRIVRAELREARGREGMTRRRAQFQEQQEQSRLQERASRFHEGSPGRQAQSREVIDAGFQPGESPLALGPLHERRMTEVSRLRAQLSEHRTQAQEFMVANGIDSMHLLAGTIADEDRLFAFERSLTDSNRTVARDPRPSADSNGALSREIERELEIARVANQGIARNVARRSHLQASETPEGTGSDVRLRPIRAIIRTPGISNTTRGNPGDISTPRPRDLSTMTDVEKQQEKLQIRQDIDAASTSKIVPPMSETELIQSLVLQFLTHDGYVETARAFADEVHAEKRALSLDPNAVVHGFDVTEDEDAGYRQRIRAAILEGDVDKALKQTNAYYPHVLKDNEHVYFRLRCRKFIEMIRQGAEMQNAATNGSKKNNGHNGDWYDDILNHDMELDDHQSQNNNWDRMDTEESSEHQAEYQRLVDDTLAYGRDLQAEFKDDQRREVSKALEDAFALMAYTDPLNAKEVSHQLDPSGRVAVAEELNSAILQSLGKSSSAALEQLYQQTTILLEDLREGGGPGAFVNIDDFVRPKP